MTRKGIESHRMRESEWTDERPNKETLEAMEETERIIRDPSVPSYTNVNDLFAALDRDSDSFR